MPKRLTQEEFIERARSLHCNKYDYSLTSYRNAKEIITVTCPLHGEFSIKAGRHISTRKEGRDKKPQGCQECWRNEARWSEEALFAEASKYRFRVDFQRNSKGAYLSAYRKGILNDVCAHMDRQLAERGYWNIENCRVEAMRYDARGQFMRGSGSAYNSALANGWLDEICKHMIKDADGYHYMVYGILNRRLKKAYVGVTKQQFNKRMSMHKQGGSTRASEIAQLEDTEFVRLTEYRFLSNDLKDAEEEWAEYLLGQKFEVLNDGRLFGRTGVSMRIYTDDMIQQEALKYSSRADFKRRSPRHYDAACSQRILNNVCSHMRAIKEKNYWTKQRCIEAAATFGSKDQFAKSQDGAYSAARVNGWLDEVYKASGLRGRNEMSWLKTGTRKEIWCNADYHYNTWTERGKCSAYAMKTITGVNMSKLIIKFQKGWMPSEDKDWREWAERVKREIEGIKN